MRERRGEGKRKEGEGSPADQARSGAGGPGPSRSGAGSTPPLSTRASARSALRGARFPASLHSESSLPPAEERKGEAPLSRQSGSSKKPAEARVGAPSQPNPVCTPCAGAALPALWGGRSHLPSTGNSRGTDSSARPG